MELDAVIWIPHLFFHWWETVELFCWHFCVIRAPDSVSLRFCWFHGSFLIHPRGRKSAHCSCIMEVTMRKQGWVAGTSHRQSRSSKLPPGWLPRQEGMCPDVYKNAELCAPASGRRDLVGGGWGGHESRGKAWEKKDPTVFLNLDKLKVSATQRFNPRQGQEDRKDVTRGLAFNSQGSLRVNHLTEFTWKWLNLGSYSWNTWLYIK